VGTGYEIGFIVLLTLANGFFAASEIALLSVRHGRLEQQAAQGSRAAARALELARDPDRFLTTVQIGITLVSTLAAAFGGARLSGELAGALRGIAWVGRHADGIAFAIIVASITWLSLVVGELVPKRMALQNAERMARISAPVMWLLAVVSRPIGAALIGSVRLVMRVIAPRGGPASRVTPADILDLAREGQRIGSVEETDAALIRKVFAFTDRRVRAAMTPRSEVVSIDVTASFDEVVRAFQTSGFSRLPVVQGALDEVVGVLYLKDILPGGGGAAELLGAQVPASGDVRVREPPDRSAARGVPQRRVAHGDRGGRVRPGDGRDHAGGCARAARGGDRRRVRRAPAPADRVAGGWFVVGGREHFV